MSNIQPVKISGREEVSVFTPQPIPRVDENSDIDALLSKLGKRLRDLDAQHRLGDWEDMPNGTELREEYGGLKKLQEMLEQLS